MSGRQVGYSPGNDGAFFMCAEDLAENAVEVDSANSPGLAAVI